MPAVSSEGIASRSPSYKVDHIGRTVKSTKLRHAWTLFLGGVETKVELEHSRLTGKKKVLVDGKLLFSTTDKHLNWCWEHPESKARIGLNSENGKHVLRCEEPEVKTLSKDAEGNSAQLDELSSAASFEAGTCNSETLPEEGCTDGAVHEDAEYEVFSSGFSDSPIRQDLARKYATCENDLQDRHALPMWVHVTRPNGSTCPAPGAARACPPSGLLCTSIICHRLARHPFLNIEHVEGTFYLPQYSNTP